VFDAELTQQVYYTGENGHVIELWWPPNDVARHEDLTVQSGGAPLAPTNELGTPASHVFASEGTQHVFYRSDESADEPFTDIIELWWRQE
jgi:hypothetical protein